MKRLYLFFFALAATYGLGAQVSFSNGNHKLANTNRSGVAIAVQDVNNDGLDDIVRLAQGRQVNIEWQRSDGGVFDNAAISSGGGQSQWSICVADVDNNGYGDILTGGSYDGVKLYSANNDGAQYALSLLPGPGLFVQGTNLADINNDGWLDFFSCHDDAESRIWANDGQGGFVAADDWIDMATVPASDNSGNYGSVWTDIDNDGDIDLYIAKCRQGVNNAQDPRRINALFINDGAGNFTERAAEANLKIGAQSWTADFGDLDNDGDMDCFITNHDVPSMVLINDGQGVFTDITATAGVAVQGLPIQGVMRDFDNDGFLDILVAGTRQHLFLNNGNLTFTEVTGLFDNNQMESFALGDLNHDGYVDIYAGYAQVYTTPSAIDDVLWLNDGGSNNFLNIRLTGVASNRSAVGARLELYGAWGLQIREVRAGESYGITNSLMQNFGLGQATSADSLVIRWPSGEVDMYENLAANQFVSIIEGACVSPPATVTVEGNTTICAGEAVVLTAPEGYSYLWSNGETTASISATATGVYQVTVSDGSSCSSTSGSIAITVNPDETPTVAALSDTVFCRGGSVILRSSEANGYQWSTGDTGAELEVTESGVYTVTIQGQCEAFTSAPISVNVLSSPTPELIDIAPDTDSVTISVTGDRIFWFLNENDVTPFANGGSIRAPFRDTSFVVYAESRTLYPGAAYATGQIDHAGTLFAGNQFNGGIIFDAYRPFILESVKVYTDTEASRIIELTNAAGDVLASLEVVIPVGIHVIPLNFAVEPGTDLFLSTNTAHNVAQLGYNSARLRRSDSGINFPYDVQGVISLKESNFGADRYYYFYDWKLKEADFDCVSDRLAVPVVLVHTDEPSAGAQAVRVYPNPTSGPVQVQAGGAEAQLEVQLFNAAGQRLWQGRLPREAPEMDLSRLPAGVYWLTVNADGQLSRQRVVKN
jgi:hypothetical protein